MHWPIYATRHACRRPFSKLTKQALLSVCLCGHFVNWQNSIASAFNKHKFQRVLHIQRVYRMVLMSKWLIIKIRWERFWKSTDTHTDTDTSTLWLRILHTQYRIQELVHFIEKRILFNRLLVVLLSQIKNISHGNAFTCIVLDIDRHFLIICKQNDDKMQCIKHGVSAGHVCQKNTHDKCERMWNIPIVCENKVQQAADVNGYGYHIRICVSARLRNLSNKTFTPLITQEPLCAI